MASSTVPPDPPPRPTRQHSNTRTAAARPCARARRVQGGGGAAATWLPMAAPPRMPADASALLIPPFCESDPAWAPGKSALVSAEELSSSAVADAEVVLCATDPRRERLEPAPGRGGLGAC